MNEDFTEGYADGIAGAGAQERVALSWIEWECYRAGFMEGSADRKTMLTEALDG